MVVVVVVVGLPLAARRRIVGRSRPRGPPNREVSKMAGEPISGERMGTGAGRGERLFRCGVMDVAMHVQVHRKHLFQREGILDRDSYALIVISSILYKVFFLIAPIGMA